ncbi:hypothetical protein STCU_08188 [Strigomonas culicis]|uniref:mRNA (guanine-N(7))-methyltransferase n=1 Tax=Strigomonas culicis TaxID=28005 RepID=S9TR56_9TRYP|nr:hypothetical protein STCU_09344 [Strigomonas culicis]EPY20852.1 hypothetical protein STCU_08803 [Strigomonas culicis]EPY22652.1 hypothetical protein STCU_08188 [Strigomonas culicis]|eukprot:EPY19664.1 hypothetical protein STCU_09344 [Strigomonas culicis]
MLNVNAKAFVPPTEVAPPPFQENIIYRYRIDTSINKYPDVVKDVQRLNNIPSLLTTRRLFAVKGDLDEESLRYFVEQNILPVANNPENENTSPSSGFLLSRTLLSLNVDMHSVFALNDAPGLLVRLDFPKEFGGEVNMPLNYAWDAFYSLVNRDHRVTAFGYSRSRIGVSSSKESGTYCHYFFVSCVDKKNDRALFSPAELSGLRAPVQRIVSVSSIVPFTCSYRTPVSVVITFGKKAKESLRSEMVADFSFNCACSFDNIEETYESLSLFEESFLDTLNNNCKWERTYIYHLSFDSDIPKEKSLVAVPIWDAIYFVGNICDDCACNIAGVSFSASESGVGVEQLLLRNKEAPFFVNATLSDIMEKKLSVDTTNTLFGGIPQHIRRPFSRPLHQLAIRAISAFITNKDFSFPKEKSITRKTFSDVANAFSKSTYVAKKKCIGTQVLIGTDSYGNLFGVEIDTLSTFALPDCFGGVASRIPECVFVAVLSPSYRNLMEYRIILQDVLVFQGSDVTDTPFSERWGYVESLYIDDEDSWRHASADHVVILRARHVPFDKIQDLLSPLPSDHCTRGLVFLCSTEEISDSHKAETKQTFLWTPPESISLFFRVSKTVEVADNDQVKKALLEVVDAETDKYAPYEDEYVEYYLSAFPDVKKGSIVECLLCRDENDAHWWDILQAFSPDAKKVSTYNEVDEFVHSPSVTQKEVLWLLNASSYVCERCGRVNDKGMRNERHNSYWCHFCWIETGHGDCVYCGRTFALGMLHEQSHLFYCENCWTCFSTWNTEAERGYHVPPPPNAKITQQVTTRCISLLIDMVNTKVPTNDVLDLCCGGSVVRKWMRNKTDRYLGIDNQSTIVDSMRESIHSSKELLPNARYNVICADVFSKDLWMETITKVHPRQFHTIACFSGLHHAFVNEEQARIFVGSVANALVPGGGFLGLFIDANILHARGKTFSNSIVQSKWEDSAVPRIGNHFTITVEGEEEREVNVVPMDFLIAVATEYGMTVMTEACQTLGDLVEKDPNWTKVPSAEEREYLGVLRSFAFKKDSTHQLPSTQPSKVQNDSRN